MMLPKIELLLANRGLANSAARSSLDPHACSERFTRVGNTLRYEVTVEDPYFVKPFVMPARTMILGKPSEHIGEDYPCIERSLDHMLSGEKH